MTLPRGVEPYGPQASEFTTRELSGRRVRLEFDRERMDQYGEEDPRIEALKQNLLRQISEKHGEIEREIGDLKSSVKAIKWFIGGLIAVFGVIAAILASAANMI